MAEVHLSVSTWQQPPPPAASPERAALLDDVVDRVLACGEGRLRVVIDNSDFDRPWIRRP